MNEVLYIVVGAVVGGLIGTGMVAVGMYVDYRIWLRNFRRSWKLEREQWFREHVDCCELDRSYLNQPYG